MIKLNCNACNSEGSMMPVKVRRLNGIVVVIGYLIVIPSVIGMLIGGVMFVASIFTGTEVVGQSVTDAEMAGAMAGTTIGIGLSLFVTISSLIGGIIGYLLIIKKKVYKCLKCGFILDRH
jgi:hypothetical protein